MVIFLLPLVKILKSTNTQFATNGTWYQEIANNGENAHDVFNEHFHQCSFKDACKFILKDLKTDAFKELQNEQDLPTDQKGYAIWKKMQTRKMMEISTGISRYPRILEV